MSDQSISSLDDQVDGVIAAETTSLTPARQGSPLASLRDRVRKAKAEAYVDLRVPRLEPAVWVRYGLVPMHLIDASNKLASKSRERDKFVIANAAILASACQGIFEIAIDGTAVSIDPDDRDGDWPKFDHRLAELLDARSHRASDVVRALYASDGDIISTANQLAEWSGYTAEQEEREAGEG